MRNALDEPQTIVVLGGTSDIGLAIARALTGPATRHVVLACRDTTAGVAAANGLDLGAGEVAVVPFDADDTASHPGFVDELAERFGDLDVVVLAFGVLGDQATFDAHPVAAAAAVTTNYSGAVSVGLAVANRLRAQGHGSLVVLSSVAGERVRRANFVYGSSKAGLDAFAQGLGDSLAGSGARGARGAAGLRGDIDDRRAGSCTAGHHGGRGRSGRRQGPAVWPAHDLGARRVALRVRGVPPPARPGLAPDAAALTPPWRGWPSTGVADRVSMPPGCRSRRDSRARR